MAKRGPDQAQPKEDHQYGSHHHPPKRPGLPGGGASYSGLALAAAPPHEPGEDQDRYRQADGHGPLRQDRPPGHLNHQDQQIAAVEANEQSEQAEANRPQQPHLGFWNLLCRVTNRHGCRSYGSTKIMASLSAAGGWNQGRSSPFSGLEAGSGTNSGVWGASTCIDCSARRRDSSGDLATRGCAPEVRSTGCSDDAETPASILETGAMRELAGAVDRSAGSEFGLADIPRSSGSREHCQASIPASIANAMITRAPSDF